MGNLSFVDKYGCVYDLNDGNILFRESVYIIMIKDNQVLCNCDQISGLMSFPSDEVVDVSVVPSTSFSIFAYIVENGMYVKELQKYNIFEVEEVYIENASFKWCDVDDLLLGKIKFDATQITGLKNLLVRVR